MIVKDIPNQNCWVIFTQSHYSTDHGYPEDGTTTIEFTDMKFYDNKESFLKAVSDLEFPKYGSKVPYKTGEFNPLNISIKTTIEINAK